MRITNNMLVSNTIWNMNKTTEQLAKAQERMSSQSKIKIPSDDPVVATRAVKYRNYVTAVEQYQKNADDALSWQNVTETAVSDLSSVMKQVRDLTAQASNGSLNNEDREQIKLTIAQLKKQAVQILNTSYAGRYIFGGYSVDKPPYEIVSTNVGDKILFKGKYLNLSGPVSASLTNATIETYYASHSGDIYSSTGKESIEYNIGYGNTVAVNLEGQNVAGVDGSNLFDTLDKLLLGLDGATTCKTVDATGHAQTEEIDLSALLDNIDQDLERLQAARSDLGARMSYTEITKDRLSNDYITYTELMSNNEDVDLAEASIEVASADYAYEASLSVGAKVVRKSLIDFLT
jgi:flagellar hook-associated protein 3 FlgL